MRLHLFQRPAVGSITLSIAVAVYVLAALNTTFWSDVFSSFGGFGRSFFSFSIALLLLVVGGSVAVSLKFLIKPFLISLIVVAAISSYYTDVFGIVIDKDMLRNVVVTTPQEARHLVTAQFVAHVLFYGVLPSLLVAAVRIRHRPFFSKLAHNLVVVVPSLLICAALLLSEFAAIASTIREHREMMAKINPFSPIASAIGLGINAYEEIGIVHRPLGTDARIGDTVAKADKPVVTVIVAGETARAMNFSLNGYDRETNPELKALHVVNYPNTTSCGTATAVSLPCMFSIYPRREYSHRKAKATDSLMDVLRHAGIDAYWWDNNTGSKGIADRIRYESLANDQDERFCRDGECNDGIFLDKLENLMSSIKGNTTIVLHQIGSHGPFYASRYPEEFRKFQPDCRTAQLSDCSHEAIVNAYDNTILYTDHMLASVIRVLQKHADTVNGAMIYMSDHGESLGENGLFLHGAPYAFAPAEQTHVPFVAWFSDGYARLTHLDRSCLAAEAGKPVSHDNLFHTVLGMMDVTTSVYDAALDAFASCRHETDNELLQSLKEHGLAKTPA